jgi:hypothetical protein
MHTLQSDIGTKVSHEVLVTEDIGLLVVLEEIVQLLYIELLITYSWTLYCNKTELFAL